MTESPSVLGLVLVPGDPGLARETYAGRTLLQTAYDRLAPTCARVVTVGEANRSVAAAVETCEPAALPAMVRPYDVVVIDDARCLDVPGDLVARLAPDAAAQPIAAVRPVVDTVKQTVDGRVVATVDRDGLRTVMAPVCAPAADVLTMLARDPHAASNPARFVEALCRIRPVTYVEAPEGVRRVTDTDGLRVARAVAHARQSVEQG